MSISNSFLTFAKEALEQPKAWGELIEKLDTACKLDKKIEALAYLSVLASARFESGIPFHVKQAKKLGTTKEDVGNIAIQALPKNAYKPIKITCNFYGNSQVISNANQLLNLHLKTEHVAIKGTSYTF